MVAYLYSEIPHINTDILKPHTKKWVIFLLRKIPTEEVTVIHSTKQLSQYCAN